MKTCIVLGCGPTLSQFPFKRITVPTFGMKNAWKSFDRMGWWPTYYANLDKVNEEYHRKDLVRIIKDPCVLTQKFFLHEKICESDRIEVVRYRRPLFDFGDTLDDLGDGGNTATNAAQIAVALGYRQLILVGVDLSYGKGTDFFIRDYREDGEPHNAPDLQTYHYPAWEAFSKWAARKRIELVNCSRFSTIKGVPNVPLSAALKRAG